MFRSEPTNEATAELEELTRGECFELLGTLTVGRIAINRGGDAAPLVMPVNYAMDGEVVVFRTGIGTKLAHVCNGRVSFEVDFIDLFHHTGWSVVIEGDAYEATYWEIGHVAVEPWVAGSKQHFIRIVPATISGRRIRLAPFALDGRPGYL